MALVVIADDDADIRSMITIVLQRAGHTVIAVDDGVQALAQARARRPDLVVTDGLMPNMTGIELCRQLAGDPGTADIPIMMVSGSIDPSEVRQQLPCLADAMAKPFQAKDLARRVQILLDGR